MKENKLEILKLKFQNFKLGHTQSLKDLDFRITTLMSEMTALGESNRYSNAPRVKTIIKSLNQDCTHTQKKYYNEGIPRDITRTNLFLHLIAVNYETK